VTAVFTISSDRIVPDIDEVLKLQGVPEKAVNDERIIKLINDAGMIFNELAEPSAVFREISIPGFRKVFHGEGLNEKRTPVGDIFPVANELALFAVTTGRPLCERIRDLFSENEYALALMLDCYASVGTDRWADVVQEGFESSFGTVQKKGDECAVMRFSPGYCGWHISGQKKLFDYLEASKIGISLNPSFMMDPVKSISAVIITAPYAHFDFRDDYAFCASCRDHACRKRLSTLNRRRRDAGLFEETEHADT